MLWPSEGIASRFPMRWRARRTARKFCGKTASSEPAETPGQWESETMHLASFAWPELKEVPMSNVVAIAPLGSFEQHGPHLPFTTDTDIVTAIGEAVEHSLPEKVLLLPC